MPSPCGRSNLAAFYAAIANEGLRPVPHSVDSIDRDGQTIYRYQQSPSRTISSVDRAAFYQLKTMMQGVLARGTAHAISGLAPYVAGKTGTSDEENDAWFVGSPMTSPSRSGWATTTPPASAAPSAAGRPGAVSRSRSSSRSGGLGQCRAESGARSTVIGGQAPALLQVDRPGIRRCAGRWRKSHHRMLASGRQRQGC